jgi:hypothetical protein
MLIRKNIDGLILNIRWVREEREKIYSSSRDITGIARISAEFQNTL